MRPVIAIFRLFTILAMVAYLALLIFAYQLRGWGDGSGSGNSASTLRCIWITFPLVYLVMAFCTSFARRKSMSVLLAGMVAHLILAVFVVPIFFIGTTGVLFAIPSLGFAVMWGIMYSELDEKAHAA